MRFKLMAAAVLLAAFASSAFACDKDKRSCAPTITACGCSIQKDGVYTVANNLTAASGLTSDGACINVESDGVVLLTNGHDITGNGSGVGINVEDEGRGAFISAAGAGLTYTTVSGWQYGMKVEADSVTSEGFYFTKNTTGVLLHGVEHNNLTLFGSYGNDAYGVQLEDSENNRVAFGGVWDNKKAGVQFDRESNDNLVFEVYAAYSPIIGVGVWQSGYGTQSYGLYIADGSTGNSVVDSGFFYASVYDLFDGNDAGDNVWHANQFVTANRGFIQ